MNLEAKNLKNSPWFSTIRNYVYAAYYTVIKNNIVCEYFKAVETITAILYS